MMFKIRYLIIMFVVIITGCNDGIVHLNATSNGDCVIKCKNLTNMNNFHCMEASAAFNTQILNDKMLSNDCECILFDCFKEIK